MIPSKALPTFIRSEAPSKRVARRIYTVHNGICTQRISRKIEARFKGD